MIEYIVDGKKIPDLKKTENYLYPSHFRSAWDDFTMNIPNWEHLFNQNAMHFPFFIWHLFILHYSLTLLVAARIRSRALGGAALTRIVFSL